MAEDHHLTIPSSDTGNANLKALVKAMLRSFAASRLLELWNSKDNNEITAVESDEEGVTRPLDCGFHSKRRPVLQI